jgi:hypothetical protein
VKRRLLLTRLGQIAVGLGIGGYAAAHSEPVVADSDHGSLRVTPAEYERLYARARSRYSAEEHAKHTTPTEYEMAYYQGQKLSVIRREDYLARLKCPTHK